MKKIIFAVLAICFFACDDCERYRCYGDTIQKWCDDGDWCGNAGLWEDITDCDQYGKTCAMKNGEAVCIFPYDYTDADTDTDSDTDSDSDSDSDTDINTHTDSNDNTGTLASFLTVRTNQTGCYTILHKNGKNASPMTCKKEHTFTLNVPVSTGQAEFLVRCESSAGYILIKPVIQIDVFAGETSEAECNYSLPFVFSDAGVDSG